MRIAMGFPMGVAMGFPMGASKEVRNYHRNSTGIPIEVLGIPLGIPRGFPLRIQKGICMAIV